jgi:UTP:GlnB (protein PII) uridylyltransferase
MKSRHSVDNDDQKNDIKECRGGLRDIEMLFLIFKAKHKIRELISRKFMWRLIEIEPVYSDKIAFVEKHLNFIKNLRDLYRLKVAANNVIQQEYLSSVAASMGFGEGDEAAEKLYNEFLQRTAQAAEVIEELVGEVRV